MSDLDTVAAAWADTLAVVQRRSALDLARTLKAGDGPLGPRPGKPAEPLNIDGHPAIRAILEAYDAGWTVIIVAGPVQDGKTYGAVVVPCLSHIVDDHRDALLAGPGKETCDAVYTAKIRGTLQASGLDQHLPQEGAASRGGVPDEILHPGGCRLYIRGAGGANQSQQATYTVRLVVLTEADALAISSKHIRRSAVQEGRSKVALFRRRNISWEADSRTIIESTVKTDRGSLILALYGESTGGRMWHPCPHCGGFFPREWSDVTYDATDSHTAASTARIRCPGCKCNLTSEEATDAAARAIVVHRGQTVVDGRAVGPVPRVSSWGIRWTSLDSPLKSKALHLLCAEHRDAMVALRAVHPDASLIRQFWRDHLTAEYPGEQAEATHRATHPTAIAARSAVSTYDRGSLPWAGDLALAMDVQEREIWWGIAGMRGDAVALSDWGVEYICHRHEQPTRAQRIAVLKAIRARALQGVVLEDGTTVPLAIDGVDVGGRGWLDQVDEYLRDTRWSAFAMRGDHRRDRGEGSGVKRQPGWWEEFHREDGRRLLEAEAEVIKERIMSGLSAKADSPVALLLPRGVAADDHLARHLSAEERVEGADGPVWIKHGKNDLLDVGVYLYALLRRAQLRRQQPRRQRGTITVGA